MNGLSFNGLRLGQFTSHVGLDYHDERAKTAFNEKLFEFFERYQAANFGECYIGFLWKNISTIN